MLGTPTCLQNYPVQVAPVGYASQVLCDLPVPLDEWFLRRREFDGADTATSPQDAILLLLRPLIGLVEVVTDPVELVSEAVECALGVSEERLEEVLLVEDRLVALNGGANLLLENTDDFFG